MAGIREASGSWSLGIWIIFGLTLAQAYCGFAADRAKPISVSRI
jgi:cyanate permease